MLLPKKTRHFAKFNLDDAGERGDYEALLDDPSVTIIERHPEKHTESEFEGPSTTELHMYVEYERCDL